MAEVTFDERFLAEFPKDEELLKVFKDLAGKCVDIGQSLRTTLVSKKGSTNVFGDEQLSVDMISDDLLWDWARKSPLVRACASEEKSDLKIVGETGDFILGWDPLDGSSIIDTNFSVGTIIAIWKVGENGVKWNGEDSLIGVTGRQQVASLIAVYGPRLSILVATPHKAQEVTLLENNVFRCTSVPRIKETGAKIFAPANLRASADLPAYRRLINYYLDNRYTLRYTGGMVPDIYQLFIKGAGVFINPVSAAAPAKLRLVFEVAPVAFLVEAAGGKTSDGKRSVLDVPIEKMEHRTAFICGTKEEVDRFEKEMAAKDSPVREQEEGPPDGDC
eukprot:GHVU01221816.1.p1 GENE.GHVU01221816.1~~GHVU01221816.1.p1  ORF type:complete len:332 (+),score=79.27 GHVU01221816.1:462-1457(+)